MKGAIPVKKQQRNAYIDNRKHRIDSRSCTTEKTEEYRKDQLNWRDDGDELSDASANDYLKGYNMDPYEFKQWASVKHNDLLKTADVETVVMKFTPEFLADRILTLWNGADGPLQNFFEAFTLRYNNNLKEQVAGELAKSGYTVYPRLFDDKPRYARLNKLMKKVAASNDLDTIMVFATNVSKNDSLNLFAGELADLREAGQPVSIDEASGISKAGFPCQWWHQRRNDKGQNCRKKNKKLGKSENSDNSDNSNKSDKLPNHDTIEHHSTKPREHCSQRIRDSL